ncbi:MAG: HD domain-containing protein [Lachnospiraceae bacterium]|nr:HD domain-containing protein [Lachnospiraceae bacterium]
MDMAGDTQLLIKKQTNGLEKDMLLSYKLLCEKHSLDDRTSVYDTNNKVSHLMAERMKQICSNTSINNCAYKLETYDKPTYMHSVRVAVLCMIIGKLMNFDKNNIIELGIAGLLHDIGKLLIPINIITKPGKLDEIEKILINSHSASSAYYLRENYTSISKNVIVGVVEHHERLDGTGYPRHLKGNEISLIGRIIAVADIFEAYSSNRSYHKARTITETIEFMQKLNGLDQRILNLFICHIDKNNNVIALY